MINIKKSIKYYVNLAKTGTKKSIDTVMQDLNMNMTIAESKFIDFALWISYNNLDNYYSLSNESNTGLNKIKYIETLEDIENYLLPLILKQKNIIQIGDDSSNNSYVRRALSYIHTHYHEHVRVKDISDFLFISPNYLSHIFKDEIGMGIINYLNNVRIEYAAHFLSTTNDKAATIAQNVGISDYKYFIKLFRKIKGVTPSEYRSRF